MATAEAGVDGFGILSDPIDRFSLPDLAGGNSMMRIEPTDTLVCTPSKSSMGDAGDAALTVEVDLHSTCEGTTLSVQNSEQSIGKDDPQAPGCTKRSMQSNGVALLMHLPCVQTSPVMKMNAPLELHASEIYTRAMFEKFGEVIYESMQYKVEEITKGETYFVRPYHPEKYEKWCRVVYKVEVAEEGKELKCECAKF